MISYWNESSTNPFPQLDSFDSIELSHSTSISSSDHSPIKRFNSNHSNLSHPRINLNKPKQWTRKAD
ncbi:uncharacterized protein MELLADRAFT_73658 [Melampsora larici-populina 98AG31]|uniref:Uncharacterized protein n=1 Tax=Melampsora larici-populina (strain 98AG31 / pathotype 3-4-7) TaxID=747676 RepID=F4SB80_MELLP|nr:uncharacterized protein MELLADRAFT_73658 [Melampsora larici-populina 98AG31]EGF98102.1 hypothetical protein MELLADRAFT_73658 [Melampsora larici-populina 98AG31]